MKKGRDILSMSVNIAVLLFLGYAVLGPKGPLRTSVQGYFGERDARSAAAEALGQVASNDGPPTLIEFTDFQCPYCRDMHDILKQGVAEGKFELVTMALPARSHPPSREGGREGQPVRRGAGQRNRHEQPSDVHERMDEGAQLGEARARRASPRPRAVREVSGGAQHRAGVGAARNHRGQHRRQGNPDLRVARRRPARRRHPGRTRGTDEEVGSGRHEVGPALPTGPRPRRCFLDSCLLRSNPAM